MSQSFGKKIKFRGGKKRHIKFSYFSARSNRLNKLFIRPVLMSQSFGKKMKFRGGKKRHIKFPYFSARPNGLNKLFI
ncbi:hypothetical protein BN424_662 [Carnobacterium maltaromaticum LMA28]|uniref:Uncharacterized protein n=1 Tax=Carnobacterium maltaromaticum LMA28 TaxID=1234679 RepID=K8ENP6_CARML|nr:hypothetical protein IV70_GL000897 [Carnobacterium maltaromaticum DSM 20342]CCO10126.2 hypothetical protein BN424_662 [Carnobacterium maltaromaticum LMA28]